MFRATLCPCSRADDLVEFLPEAPEGGHKEARNMLSNL